MKAPPLIILMSSRGQVHYQRQIVDSHWAESVCTNVFELSECTIFVPPFAFSFQINVAADVFA